jgi:transcriptional regulator with XRE-family HTH domain
VRSAELGTFLRSRRERLDPTTVGFAPSIRRRAAGLRREELATLAGVAVSWLAKLEQGRAHGVSPEVLGALAEALRLDPAERDHLFALAGLRIDAGSWDAAASAVVDEPGPALRALLDRLDPDPAYLLDRTWRIVAHNAGEAALFPPVARATEPPNLLELAFCDDDLAALMADHAEEQVRLVAQFRLHATDWPSAELDALLGRLHDRSSRFAALWADHDVAPFETTRRVFDHPVAGRLVFDHHRLAVLDRPGFQLVVYTSPPGTDTSRRLLEAR